MKNRQQILEAGKLGARKNRLTAEEKYYANQPICEYCGELIPLNPNAPVKSSLIKRFCNCSCAASFNNSKILKRDLLGKCIECNKKISSTRKYCPECFDQRKGKVTKGQLIEKCGKRNACVYIRTDARKVCKDNGLKKICAYCGYNIHTEVCHKRDIRDFDNNTRMSEINDINNLVILCPNHHWEFDHGILTEEDIKYRALA